MDFNDLFGFTGVEGTRRTRWFTGLLGAFVGGGLGALIGPAMSDTAHAVYSYGFIGGVLGGGLGALFSGAIILGLLIVIVVAAIVGWQIYTGG